MIHRMVIVIAGFLCLHSQANAAPITIEINAELSFVNDFANVLGGAFSPGDSLSGRYTYDSSTTDSNALPTVGDYWHTGSQFGMTILGGGFVFQTNSSDVDFLVEMVDNNPPTTPSDAYIARSYSNLNISNGAFIDTIAIELQDSSATVLNNTNLPLGAPVLADWPVTNLTIRGCATLGFTGCPESPDRFFIRANLTSATLVPAVPVPAAVWLFGSALMGLAGICKLGKQKEKT